MKDKGLNLIEKLPTYDSYRHIAIRRRKKFSKIDYLVYRDLEKVKIPPAFDDFLFADYNDNKKRNSRILIFASEKAREHLKYGKTFFGDGTFENCPRPFKQLYVVFCDLGSSEGTNNVVPVIYALLPNKFGKSYSIMFEIIKSQIPEWAPNKFIMDFEPAPITAIRNVFPEIKLHGCFFHFQDRLKKKAKKLTIIKRNTKTNKIVSLCIVLPLLPEANIDEGLHYILKENKVMGSNNKLELFLSYVQDHWMPKKALWCTFGERHRTNNVCEGWNGQFNKSLKKRPTILHLLKILKKDAMFHAVNAVTSEPAKKRSKPVVDRNTYIQHVQMQLITGEIDVPLFMEKLR
ncbi:uncharacterized protein LOC134679120 [Cydia fagiglandana]|uniref:uncharacterized protein LOC134679120 n=1 Tax=Cydia fagiglandana TaxID=1458189 RepID=UPI002FEE4104